MTENKMQKEWIMDNIRSGDRYKFPIQVLDTDYKDYLVMYRCREEYRKVTDADDMNPV